MVNDLTPAEENFYLYRIEQYLIHKYRPELVDEFAITLRRARLRREGVVQKDENIIQTKEELLQRIGFDLSQKVPWKPAKNDHKRTSLRRPGIGTGYQRQFEEL